MARTWQGGEWVGEDDVVEQDRAEVREVEAREADEVREDEAKDKDRGLVRPQVPGEPYEGAATIELLETTDVEDIQALSDALVEVIQGAAYDDMSWPEVDMALRRTSHAIRQNWAATGTVKAAAEPPPEDAPARAADEEPRYAS
jgi:hypothetical protein